MWLVLARPKKPTLEGLQGLREIAQLAWQNTQLHHGEYDAALAATGDVLHPDVRAARHRWFSASQEYTDAACAVTSYALDLLGIPDNPSLNTRS